MKDFTKEYTNGDITVIWQPSKCIHSALCISGLSAVFDLDASPWVNMQGAESERIIEQVKACPSGALIHYLNEGNNSPK